MVALSILPSLKFKVNLNKLHCYEMLKLSKQLLTSQRTQWVVWLCGTYILWFKILNGSFKKEKLKESINQKEKKMKQ